MESLLEIEKRVDTLASESSPLNSAMARRGREDLTRLGSDPRLMALIDTLRDGESWREQVEAWEKLRDMGASARGWEAALRDLIHQTGGWPRILAAEALANQATAADDAVPVLLYTLEAALQLGQFAWARMACGAIGRFATLPRPLMERTISDLTKALAAEDSDVQGYAALALGNFGLHARPALVRLAELHEQANGPLEEHFAEVLRKIDPDIEKPSDARIIALDDREEAIRAEAVAAIGRRSDEIIRALPQLLRLFGDDSPAVRRNLALALADLASPDAEVMTRLAHLCRDPHPAVRMAASYASVRLGQDIKAHCAHLREGLSDTSTDVRGLAAWALGKTGHHFPWRSQSALKKALRGESHPTIRRTMERALSQLG